MIKISPNSLNLYFECPFCFWLEKNRGIKRPAPFPYELNLAVDQVLRRDFDKHRAKDRKHPLLEANNIPAKLFSNQKLLNEWRNKSKGLEYYDEKTGAVIFGVLDDVLDFGKGKLAPFDYKSTGSSVPKVYDRFQLQMDVYTFLLEKNGYATPRKGVLVFYTVDKDDSFDDRLPFKKEIHIIDTDPSYILRTFREAIKFLKKPAPLAHSPECEFGRWAELLK
ncbi:PD-(D/E)XK nuclease family protein [Patescibacteria group bacterium]|nr:PD-(D/E)XK nuclease family protein [Patescibacteria group bacterium]MBU4023219.1 PD-(D/E)XK nuclease family protein [Patescibacteria group bacterium]MBU4162181.1 PD-(D/E)XK nuclease family protein [Patescibacteria group bacterium]